MTLSQAVRTNKQTATKQNLFQKKRRLVKSIEKCKSDYERGEGGEGTDRAMFTIFPVSGSKEVDALQLMIKTYKETPEFGDGKKFQQELKVVTERLGRLETELAGLNRELDLVESAMCLNIRHSLISAATDTGSETSDYTSSNSIDDNLESGGEEGEEGEDWAEEFEEVKLSPVRKLLALYSYDGGEEGTIAIKLGDELELLEEDTDGWSRVRRSVCAGQEEEEVGFIPTSFTSPITDS